MKVQRVVLAFMLLVGAGRGQYFRLPTPPIIKFGHFRPLFQAIFRQPFLKSGHGHFRRPPPPLPPPMDPHFFPPVLPPIHTLMKPPPPLSFKQNNSPRLKKLPLVPPEFGAPKPSSIIALSHPPFGVSDQSNFHLSQKPHQSFRAPHHLQPPVTSGFHSTSTLPNIESNLIAQPSMGKPPNAAPIKEPHIVKLKPIKMIAKPNIHFPPPPSLPHSDSMPSTQGTFTHSHDTQLGSKVRPSAHQSGGHMSKPLSSVRLQESPTKGTHSSSPQDTPSRPQSPAHQNALFIRTLPNSNISGSSSSPLPGKEPHRPFQNDVTGHLINQVPHDVRDHAFTKMPILNAGVLPLANEIEDPPNLRFPPFVK